MFEVRTLSLYQYIVLPGASHSLTAPLSSVATWYNMKRTYAGTDGRCMQEWRRLEVEQMSPVAPSHRQG